MKIVTLNSAIMFVSGLFLGVTLSVVEQAVSIDDPPLSRVSLGKKVTIRWDDKEFRNEFDVYRNDEMLFSGGVISNAFHLSVPSAHGYPPAVLFSETKKGESKIQRLRTSRLLEDGSKRTVSYDMKTGDIDRVMITDTAGNIMVYDSEGSLLDEADY